MSMFSNFISKVVGEKGQWQEYKARARQLPANYRAAVDALERYLNYAGTGGDSTAMYADLIDLFEQSAANGTPIREIVGEDPVEFIETFVRNYPKGQWLIRERERLTNALERVSGSEPTALGVAALAPRGASARSGSSAESSRFASVDEWIAREAIPFSSDKGFNVAVDRMMSHLGDPVSLLGFGEALHGGDEFLTLRNRFFQRLVEAHGFSTITLEITDTRARLVNAYISGRGPATYEAIEDKGFSYGAGRYAANRELVEWMKRYNADPAHAVKLSFYGTLPSEQGDTTESPRLALELALTYLESVDDDAAARHRGSIEPLLGTDADWEGPAAVATKEIMARILGGANAQSENQAADARQEFALSPRAQALRLAVENLAFEWRMRRPELVARSDRESFNAALYDLSVARNLLALHAALARRESLDTLVSMRDAMAAEHLVYIAEREKTRGRILVHLHNAHLRRTRTKLPWYEFWPTGAHLEQLFGERFAVIGGAVGTSEANFIGAPEPGSLEARLLAQPSDCFIPARRGNALSEGVLAALPVRTGSARPYVPYEPLTPQRVADVDMIVFLRSVTYTRGAPALPG